MKRFAFNALGIIALIILQISILSQTEIIALSFAPEYQEPSDSAFGGRPAMPSSIQTNDETRSLVYEMHMYETAERIYSLDKRQHYQRYFDKHVLPVQQKVVTAINLTFLIIYLTIAVFLLVRFYRWLSAGGEAVLTNITSQIVGTPGRLFSKIGIKTALTKHKLNRAETEFNQAKTLFDNGLISEDVFLTKKQEIEQRIRDGKLLN
jgi:hypothetical protein